MSLPEGDVLSSPQEQGGNRQARRRRGGMSEGGAVRIGLVGAAGRGGSFRAAMVANGARVQAACDTNEERLAQAAEAMGAEERYTCYEDTRPASLPSDSI